jgi:hypothetical protein
MKKSAKALVRKITDQSFFNLAAFRDVFCEIVLPVFQITTQIDVIEAAGSTGGCTQPRQCRLCREVL